MTTGQLLFYAGVALLLVTVILAVIFLIKKPVYRPENVAYAETVGQTQSLRNGYPTDRLTIRKETKSTAADTAPPNSETIPLNETAPNASEGTELLQSTEQPGARGTERLDNGTVPLMEQPTSPSAAETAPLCQNTVLLNPAPQVSAEEGEECMTPPEEEQTGSPV